MATNNEGLEDSVTCSICLSVFNKPKALPCLHTYCEPCLQDHVNTTQKDGVFSCPLCKANTKVPPSGVAGFMDNFLFHSLIEKLNISAKKGDVCSLCHLDRNVTEAVKYCIDCSDPLCVSCCVGHTHSRFTRGHRVVNMNDVNRGKHRSEIQAKQLSYCKEHPKEQLVAFCEDCSIPICMLCKTFSHESHTSLSIAAGVTLTEKEFNGYMKAQCVRLEFAKCCVDDVKKAEDFLENEVARVTGLILGRFERDPHVVSQLLAKVQEIGTSIREQLNASSREAQGQQSIIFECVSALQAFVDNKSDIDKLITYKTMKEKLVLNSRANVSIIYVTPLFIDTQQLPYGDLKLDSEVINKSFVMSTGKLVQTLLLNSKKQMQYFQGFFINGMLLSFATELQTQQKRWGNPRGNPEPGVEVMAFIGDCQIQRLGQLTQCADFNIRNHFDIACNDKDGNIYVLNHGMNGLVVFDKAFNFLNIIEVPTRTYSKLFCFDGRLALHAVSEGRIVILKMDGETERVLDYSKVGLPKESLNGVTIVTCGRIVLSDLSAVYILNSTGRRILHTYRPEGELALQFVGKMCSDDFGFIIVLDYSFKKVVFRNTSQFGHYDTQEFRKQDPYETNMRLHIITITGERVSLIETSADGPIQITPVGMSVTGFGEVSLLLSDGTVKVFRYLER